eukprot:CAMPEP_0113598476 /NCGR_PEP_ID=MMETSP0015_2-20120614/41612_1 /TAXON_ID=2838 /ORGANISM="Odontella" /LENGTH=58 /DNA_ID=CAMNT_0000506505 /DNA_START=40 /DNA_END=212 /DNA_ORIENTATION=- /assembly_acc=CAM_ASM_000160
MAGSDDMAWADLGAIVEHTPGALEQLLVHLERTGKRGRDAVRGMIWRGGEKGREGEVL